MAIESKKVRKKCKCVNTSDAIAMVDRWLRYDEEMMDLILIAIKGLKGRVNKMQQAFSSGNIGLLKELTHSLKGISGNFGMEELYQLLLSFDAYLRQHKILDKEAELFLIQVSNIVEIIPIDYCEEVLLSFNHKHDKEGDLKIIIGVGLDDVITVLSTLFSDRELNVVIAKSGLEILELFYLDDYDMLILKDKMDVMDAYEVIETIASGNTIKDSKIIVFTENEETNEHINMYKKIALTPFDSVKISKEIMDTLYE